MRILLVSCYDLAVAGGVTSHVMDLARQYRTMGHSVALAGPARSAQPPNSYTQYIGGTFRFPTPGDNAFVNLNPLIGDSVRRFLSDQEFDVVHVHEPFLGFIGSNFLRHTSALRIGTFHATREGPHLPYAVFQPLIARWSRLLDGRIAVSETAKQTVGRYFPGEYTTIPNGIEFARFAGPARKAHKRRRQTILFVGRLEERKGVSYLLKAYGELKRRLPRVNLVLIGDGRGRQKYEKLAARMGLEDVAFRGFVPAEKLPDYYRNADVVCQPSTCNESFGITVLEAMASGTPVVSSNIAGFHDLVEDGVTGLSVAPKDSAALADALEAVLTDSSLSRSLAASGRAHAEQFDWPVVAQRLVNFYETVYERASSEDVPRTTALASEPT